MHIVSGQVQTQSQHLFKHAEQQVSVRQRLPAAASTPAAPAPASPSTAPASNTEEAIDSGADLETNLLKALVEAMTGRHINTLKVAQSAAGDSSAPPVTTNTSAAPVDNSRVLRIDATQISEAEVTQVAITGQFSTAEGGVIGIDLHYALQRSYAATTLSASISSKATDPLLLNFDGKGVALDPAGTQFDLNSDNVVDTLPTLRAGSAYLALDRNGDGVINNGSELFGPQSGNGYGELKPLDSDGNGFIDSADPLFNQLLLFRPGEATQTLASRDVGAIFLGSAASPARLTDSNNQSLGQLRATGFYLTNAGKTGLVQQVDLVT